jgi:hypothetical protein
LPIGKAVKALCKAFSLILIGLPKNENYFKKISLYKAKKVSKIWPMTLKQKVKLTV